VEYEQNGEDRAKYGNKLLAELARGFSEIKGLDERSFRAFRLLYLNYPQIRGSLTPEFNLERINAETLLSKLSYTHLVLC
jgi:hypothetical protein